MATKVQRPPARRTKGEPPPLARPSQNLTKRVPEGLVHLNFRVTNAFHHEFKMYAFNHSLSMVDLLQRAFEQYKESPTNESVN